MKDPNIKTVSSRRTFIGTTAATIVTFAISPLNTGCSKKFYPGSELENEVKVNSNFGGVQIGTVTYSFRAIEDKSAFKIFQYCVDSGVSSIEFMGGPAEIYAGIPSGAPASADIVKQNIGGKSSTRPLDFSGMTIGDGRGWGSYPGNEEQRKWRISVPMTKFKELRKIYNDAGVDIHIFKVSPATWSDEEIDYAFRAGKALGAKALSEELDWVEGAVPRLASFAEKHDMYLAFHVHEQFGRKDFSVDPYLAISPKVMLSFDAGHYYGATGLNPCGFIEKYRDRIFSIHLKDKTGPKTDPPNTNQVWGQGETPLWDVLLLLKKHAGEKDWPKYADIELEYPVPKWSDPVKEVRKCVNYAKNILICG
jgi:sugar phosphate isomerase/epimerase